MAKRKQSGVDAMASLLDQAERLFALKGFHAVTVREITEAAGVRLASAHYYFKSKRALYEAVFARRTAELNASRAALMQLVDVSGPLHNVLTAIARAYVEPLAFRACADAGWRRHAYLDAQSILCRDSENMVGPLCDESGRALFAALGPDGAGLSPEDAAWGAMFTIGATARMFAGWRRFERLSQGQLAAFSLPMATRALIAFVAGGLERLARPGPADAVRPMALEDTTADPRRGKRATDDRILDAAEALFAKAGFHGVTIRQITERAGVSVAHAHYYFGSKEALFRAMAARRSHLVNADRNAALNAFRASGDIGADCAALSDAYIRPLASRLLFRGRKWRDYTDAMVPACNAQDDYWLETVREFDLVLLRTARVVEGLAPPVSRGAAMLTFLLMLGPMLIALAPSARIDRISGGAASGKDLQKAFAKLLVFTRGGAPAGRDQFALAEAPETAHHAG